ncbi:MAG: cation:proton antiporter [Desulfofustis sp.]|nr:cation:proton antiporter [Desulfofustis sp.]
MDLVGGLVFVCVFLIGLCAVEHYARRSPLPIVCWVVLFGAAYGMLNKFAFPGWPVLQPTSDVILYLLLPVLIFDSSRNLNLKVSQKMAIPSAMLASLGILVSAFVMAIPLRLFSSLPWMDILLFSAIMSATDPVAVSAVFTQFKVPQKLRMLIEGESLLNDGTTVILFMLLFGKVIEGHELLFYRGVAFFVLSVAGAIVLGVVAGWVGVAVLRKWKALKDHFIGPLFPLLIVYLVFCAAQAGLDISGVLAVMAATLTMKILMNRMTPEEKPSRNQLEFYRDFWEFLGTLANAILFFLLGVEIGSHTGEVAWRLMGVAVIALVLSRSIVVYGFSLLFRLLGIRLPMSWQHVLNLGGLKGALSVALILMIPRDYIYRDIFLLAALVMSFFTLFVNTLSLRVYLRYTKLPDTHGSARSS